MPWQPEPFNKVIREAKHLISKYYKINLTTPVYICSSDEMAKAMLEELEDRRYDERQANHIKKIYLRRIIGKYFLKRNEIWLLEGKGDNLEVLIHEFLHSIQKCDPNREKIVDYLTYKLTGLTTQIPKSTLLEWQEIEKSYGIKLIINQLLLEQDCEEFD